jgi:saccharopine dehydrogenase (NAD+, L-lysine forming)
MVRIGLIREGKIPADNRVAFTPTQCKWIEKNYPDVKIIVQESPTRCFSDKEYRKAGIDVEPEVRDCDVLVGIKEIPLEMLIPYKTYYFFSHTKKLQPYNQKLIKEIIHKRITLVDYECLEHADGTRLLGFGFFAGIVGAHNGIMAYGERTGAFELARINSKKTLRHLIHTYFGLKLPNVKIAVTGTGRVAHGVLEVMNLLGIHEIESEEYRMREKFDYPVYVHLKGTDLYEHKDTGAYDRLDFHANPDNYKCKFTDYLSSTDILMNGVYWEPGIPRLFEREDMARDDFRIRTIADITDDKEGSIPCNLGDTSIDFPVYGVDRITFEKTAPYLPASVDVIAVGNLPNELPKDASRYFGQQIIKEILPGMIYGKNDVIEHATIVREGVLTERFSYMKEYAGVE